MFGEMSSGEPQHTKASCVVAEGVLRVAESPVLRVKEEFVVWL